MLVLKLEVGLPTEPTRTRTRHSTDYYFLIETAREHLSVNCAHDAKIHYNNDNKITKNNIHRTVTKKSNKPKNNKKTPPTPKAMTRLTRRTGLGDGSGIYSATDGQ